MLPLAHIFVATQVTGKKTPFLVLGSVLPDIAWISTARIGKEQIHQFPDKFYNFVAQKHVSLTDLALGTRLHKAADIYSDGKDDDRSGFAYTMSKSIEPKVADLIHEPSSQKSIVLAHHFIEGALDLTLNKLHPEILVLYEQTLSSIDMDVINGCLAEYLQLPIPTIETEIRKYFEFLGPSMYISEASFSDRISLFIESRVDVEVDKLALQSLINGAMTIMSDKTTLYLDSVIEGIKKGL